MRLPKEFWDIYMRVYALWMPHYAPHRRLLDELIEKAQPSSDGVLVDAGCGPGLLIDRLLAGGHTGYIYGYDFSPSAVEFSGAKFASRSRVQIRSTDLDKLDWNQVPIADAIFFSNVLYAVRDPEAVLRSAASRLKSGGVIACTALSNPSVEALLAAHEAWLRDEATDEERMDVEHMEWAKRLMVQMNQMIASSANTRHFHVWDDSRLTRVLESVGLGVESVNGAAYAGTSVLAVARKAA